MSTTPRLRVVTVCLGNICRSPMAAAVLRERLAVAGLHGQVEVLSAGTAGWHVGSPADERAAHTLRTNGYDAAHVARRFNTALAQQADVVLAMDTNNYSDLVGLVEGSGAQLRMFREFDPLLSSISPPDPALDVPDPYYGSADGFAQVLDMLERAADGVVADLARKLQA